MTDTIREWVVKGEEDFRVAQRLRRPGGRPTPNAVCFHCQQCAEKYLKALCVSKGIRFEKRHDLLYLLALLVKVEPSLEFLRTELQNLSRYAVEVRYPGDFADQEEAETAFRQIKLVRRILREKLGLVDHRAGRGRKRR
jgi:HEPN domain-containing protein